MSTSSDTRSCAAHLQQVFNRKEQDRIVRECRKIVKDKNLQFDSFVVRGVSGITMEAILARILNKNLIIVRKPETGHSPYVVENYKSGERMIFLDDLIASGRTFESVKDNLNARYERLKVWYPSSKKHKIIGTMMYFGSKVKYKNL